MCIEYCERQRPPYLVVGLVVDNGRIRWAEIRGMFIADEADVLVLARREHLPPQRRPRIEVVDEHPTGARAGPHTRRARIVRRPGSGAG